MPSLLRLLLIVACLHLQASANDTVRPAPGTIEWQRWSDDIFEKAKRENRFVLLDLEAVWCHWCHVMEEITYHDPKVIELINARFIPVRVDQDSRPDLSNRYEYYGWPATIVFNTDGSEIVKRRGYIPPNPMASLLQAIIDDPSPGPSVLPEPVVELSEGALGSELRAKTRELLVSGYDSENHGWGTVHKFLDWDLVEYCMGEAARGDRQFEKMARETVAASRRLIDPVWGGIYQYSTDGDWEHPHFEKIMQMQAENLRIYAVAYALWKDPADLEAAQKIRAYLRTFLMSPDGAYYTSQDADVIPGEHAGEYFALSDAERRKKGIPRIDRNIYSRENGWAIHGLAALYAVTSEQAVLDDAVRSAKWILANRSMEGGGFRHGEKDVAGPYLGDTVSMARAFLSLYGATAERAWLKHAEDALRFADSRFKSEMGYVTAAASAAVKPKPQVDENAMMARVANLLHHYTGNTEYRRIAEHAMRFVAAPVIVDQRGIQVGPNLLADREFTSPPLHITIVGGKDDAAATSLFRAALAHPSIYKRIDWWDHREGPLPNADVPYPKMEKAAAFICTDRTCSIPLFTTDALATFVRRAENRNP
jgi:uncharacterized protein YyaL (SSP411 family)